MSRWRSWRPCYGCWSGRSPARSGTDTAEWSTNDRAGPCDRAPTAYKRGQYHDARPLAERAIAIGEATLGPDHPDMAYWRNTLGSVLHALGDLPGARAEFERSLQIGEATLGPDHLAMAGRHSNFGNVLRDLGDLPGARTEYERAIEIGETSLGLDHPDMTIGTTTSNYSSRCPAPSKSRRSTGDYGGKVRRYVVWRQ